MIGVLVGGGGTHARYCNKCKEHTQASKKLDFWNLPEVLILQLKRFSHTRWSRSKVDDEVLFPLEGLDMAQFMSPKRVAAQVTGSRAAYLLLRLLG